MYYVELHKESYSEFPGLQRMPVHGIPSLAEGVSQDSM